MTDSVPTLHVCVTCRAGMPLPEGETPAGERLFEAVRAQAGPDVLVVPVQCLASCDRGCTAAISQAGKFTYLLGHLSEGLVGDLLVYAAAYGAAKTGGVMPSKRPASLSRMIQGRTPDLAPALGEAA